MDVDSLDMEGPGPGPGYGYHRYQDSTESTYLLQERPLDPTLPEPSSIMKSLRLTLRLVYDTMNANTLLITLLSVLSTIVSHRHNITLDISTSFISLAVIFPSGISINAAFNRREEALRSLAKLKASMFSIRLAFNHWMVDESQRRGVIAGVDNTLKRLCADVKGYLTPATFDPQLVVPIIAGISSLSRSVELLRKEGIPSPELAQLRNRIQDINEQLETLQNIRIYRTPIAMRGYLRLFIYSFPIIFGPTFNQMSNEAGGVWHGILLAIIYSLILTGIDNIQSALENPFDGDGKDDIQFYEPKYLLNTLLRG